MHQYIVLTDAHTALTEIRDRLRDEVRQDARDAGARIAENEERHDTFARCIATWLTADGRRTDSD